MAKVSRKLRGRRKTKALSFTPAIQRVATLRDVPDLTAAIVAGTLLEGALERALARRMCRLSAKEHNSIFHSGPLRNFAAKIPLGRALSLYGPNTEIELRRIADIRNLFAHSIADVTFESKPVRTMCFDLKRPEMRAVDFFSGTWSFTATEVLSDDVVRASPKFRYLKTVTVLIFMLESSEAARPKREVFRAWPGFFG